MSFDLEKNQSKEEDNLTTLSKSLELKLHDLVLNDPKSKQRSLARSAKPGRKLILNSKQVKGCENWVRKLFLTSSHGLPSVNVPRHLLSVDEKYLRACLEAIHVTALKGASCGVSGNSTRILHIGYSQADHGSPEVLGSSVKFVVGYPSMIWNPVEQCVLGSITESNSMIGILSSPLFRRLGLLGDSKNSRPPLLDNKSFAGGGERGMFGHGYGGDRSDVLRGDRVFASSARSVSVDQSLNHRGMLQCRWVGGLLHFEFSVDDQEEVYVASAFRADSANKALDYVYSFHLKNDAGHDDMVGRMKVSTSFLLCPNSSKVAETEFVLFGVSEDLRGDKQTQSKTCKRNRRLSRVMEAFKSRTSSSEGATSLKSRGDLVQSEFLPELELAAIVVKHRIQVDSHEKEDTGGWGLKFLRKPGSTQCPSFEAGSMSADIILSADFHGRPTNEDGRPSSIVERWKSGGRCNCGGWDVGCPITVLESTPGDCKSFDISLKVPHKYWDINSRMCQSDHLSWSDMVTLMNNGVTLANNRGLAEGRVRHEGDQRPRQFVFRYIPIKPVRPALFFDRSRVGSFSKSGPSTQTCTGVIRAFRGRVELRYSAVFGVLLGLVVVYLVG